MAFEVKAQVFQVGAIKGSIQWVHRGGARKCLLDINDNKLIEFCF